MAESLPGKGLWGWLGRQIAHVRSAVKSDAISQVIYRRDRVEQAAHPEHPELKLRRTTIDEVIVRTDAEARKSGR